MALFNMNTKQGLPESFMKARQESEAQGAPIGGQATPPTSGGSPGPVESPNAGQTGTPPWAGPRPSAPAPPPPPPPPAIASAVQGVEGSEETGGVRGSFGQAGTAGFSKRFGGDGPAQWYRQSLEQMLPEQARQARERRGGGGLVGSASKLFNPLFDKVGGRLQGLTGDADMQRLMAEAMRRLFGGA